MKEEYSDSPALPLITASDSSSDSGEENDTTLLLPLRPNKAISRHAVPLTRLGPLVVLSIANTVLVAIWVSLFSVWYYNSHVLLNPKIRQMAPWTPLLDRVDLNMVTKQINGTFYPHGNYSVAREMPNEKADAIWNEWELSRVIPVTAQEIRKMGKDPSTAVKLPDEIWGLGDDTYAATMDVFHQLHCLNTLRKLAYPDYYTNPKMFNEWPLVQDIHMNHCVDILLQVIQCSGNLNLNVGHWVDHFETPFPDMSGFRQCPGNFDDLTRWRMENSLDMGLYVMTMAKPEHVKAKPAPDGYYTYYNPDNLTNPNHPNGSFPDEDFSI